MAYSHPDHAAAVAWVQAQSPDWTKTNGQLVLALNALTVANPMPQPQVPRVLLAGEMLALFTDPTELAAATERFTGTNGVIDLLRANDHPGVLDWIEDLHAIGKFSDATRATLEAYVSGTVGDPNWSATICAPDHALGRLVDAEDVQGARP